VGGGQAKKSRGELEDEEGTKKRADEKARRRKSERTKKLEDEKARG
jgi:hypothetical protein